MSVPRQGRELRDEVWRRRFILPPDLHDDLAFILHLDNWLMFRSGDFDPRHVDFFYHDLGFVLTDNEEEQDEGHDDEDDGGKGNILFINGATPDVAANPEIQPPDLL
jgi:hypothetical protein